MGPQLLTACEKWKILLRKLSFWEVLVDTFANTLAKELFGKEFIPIFDKFREIFPDY